MEEEVKRSKSGEAQAMKMLSTCLNGKPLWVLDEKGSPESAIFCSNSKEEKL